MDRYLKRIIGIDPGKTGAIASISFLKDEVPLVCLFPMPETLSEKRDLLCSLATNSTDIFIFIEYIHSSPNQGVVSACTFGKGAGQLEGICSMLEKDGAIVKNVRPQDWQAAVAARTAGDKSISRDRAKILFPSTKNITLANADALLIAYYGYLKTNHGR